MAIKKGRNLKVSAQAWLSRSKKPIKVLLIVVSSRTIRWFVIMLLFGVSVWLLYTNMWLPLNHVNGLPPGVSPRNPEVQEDMLRELHIQRAERVQHTKRSYINALNYFQVPKEE